MPILKISLATLAFSFFTLPCASAAGARALCTGPSGLTVEVDFLKSTMRISFNELATGWSEIFEQGLTEEKRVVLAAGNPENPAILVLNDTVGSASTLLLGERQVELICQ